MHLLTILININIVYQQYPNYRTTTRHTKIQIMHEQSQISEQQFNQFIISIKSGSLQQIDQYLQKYGASISNKLQSQLRQPPLYFAINLHQDSVCLTVVQKLVAKGANPNFKDSNEQSIIFYACRDGKIMCVDYLQSIGVSLFEQDAYGQTPLYYIASENQRSLIPKYKNPSDYNHVDKLAQQTPLYYAAKKGYLQMCKLLIENGCDPTHHDSHNKTAVQYARRARYHQVTEYISGEIKRIKDIKDGKDKQYKAGKGGSTPSKQQKEVKDQKQMNQGGKTAHDNTKKANNKKQIQTESVSNVPRSFYKIVYVNDQGETKDLTEEQIRVLVRQKPVLESLLASPGSIPRQALEAERQGQEKQKWQKVATKIVQVIWKHKGAGWFQQPVDSVKFGILDYNDIITHPMDIGTIKKKLQYNFYTSPQHLASDFKLVWDNCYKYNGLEHEISLCAKQLESLFNQLYKNELKQYEKRA